MAPYDNKLIGMVKKAIEATNAWRIEELSLLKNKQINDQITRMEYWSIFKWFNEN